MCYVASPSRPLPIMFKLCPFCQKWPTSASHFYVGLYMKHINIFLSETTMPTAYNWYVASRSRVLLSLFKLWPWGQHGAAKEVTCFIFIEKALKIFMSDNKKHKVLIFGMYHPLMVLYQVVVLWSKWPLPGGHRGNVAFIVL